MTMNSNQKVDNSAKVPYAIIQHKPLAVSGFKTSKNEFFEKKEDAIKAQHTIDFKQAINNFVSVMPSNMSKNDLKDILYNNSNELYVILGAFLGKNHD